MENSLFFPAKQTDNAQFSFIDASSLFVVEATGDSEVDFDPDVAITDLAGGGGDDDDDDDAESSSCDVLDQSRVSEFNDCSFEKVEASNVNNVVVDDDDEDEEDRRGMGSDGSQGMNQKSCVSSDSTNESMNEMEKNRLFWEACLAS